MDEAPGSERPLASLHPTGGATFDWERIEARAREQTDEPDDIQVSCRLLLALRTQMQQEMFARVQEAAKVVNAAKAAAKRPETIGGSFPAPPASPPVAPVPRPPEAAPPPPPATRTGGQVFRLAWPLARAFAMLGGAEATRGRPDTDLVPVDLSLGTLRFADSVLREQELER